MVEQPNLKLIYSTKVPSQKAHRELKLSAQLYPKRLPEGGEKSERERERKFKQAFVLQELKPIQALCWGRKLWSRIRNPLTKCPASYSIPLKANSSHSVNGLLHPKLLHQEL